MLEIESVKCGGEEEKRKERGKEKEVEVYRNIGTSSWRVMFQEKDNLGIPGDQIHSDHRNAANPFQAWNSQVTRDVFRRKVGEEKVVLESEELRTGVKEYFRQKGRGGDDGLMRNQADEQGKVSDEMGATVIEQHAREKKKKWGLQSIYPAEAVTAGSSRQKEKVFKKAEKTGMIFMCSHWMKQDCFDYKVFGLPASMRDVVQKVPKGTRLFLFDTDFGVMHGIYKAAAPGDYNIEPNAFKSVFPSQIRFTLVEECRPLAEENIRMAIKDYYNWRNMFYCQLTSEQVNVLSQLFLAARRGPSFCFKVKQENLIMDEENALFRNKENTAIEEVNEAVPTEVMMQNEEDTIPPAYVSHGPASDGPLVRPHNQKRNRSWQLRNRDAEVRVIRSREKEEEKKREEEEEKERKKFLKDSEMNRHIVDECRTLEMLIQSTAAKGEAMHLAVEKVEEDMKLLKDLEMQSSRVHEECKRLGMLIQSTAEEYKAIKQEVGDVLMQSTAAQYKAMLENTNEFYYNP